VSDKILSIVRALTNPVIHFLVEPDALLTDLGFMDEIDLCGLRDAVELGCDVEIPTPDMLAWRTLADVAETARAFEGVGG